MSEKITNKDFEKIQNILYNYNLLDDYFIDQDVSSNVGEIFVQNPDANVSLNTNDKEMVFQMGRMVSAVDKIWKGYLSAYDKATYKRQFDQYPLRDFDEYMASLGAKRSVDEKDFEPTGKITDWLELVNKEKKLRVGDFESKKAEEQKQIEEQQILDKDKQKEEEKKKQEQTTKKEQINTNPQKDATNVQTNQEISNYIPENLRNSIQEEQITSNDSYEKIKQDYEEKKKAEEENKSSNDAGAQVKRTEEREKAEKLLKEKRDFLKGEIVKKDKQNAINTAMNPYEFKISKGFDGFHTQGPFCLEKRKYFIEIFRPSISHFDTEFREATHEPQRIKDEGNDIIKDTHTFVKSPLEDNKIDPSTLMGVDANGQFRLNPDGSPKFPVILNQNELDALAKNNPGEQYKQSLADALSSFVSAYVHKFDTGNGSVSGQALSLLKEKRLVKLQNGVYIVDLTPSGQISEGRNSLKIEWIKFIEFTILQSDWSMALFIRLADVINKDDVSDIFKKALDAAPNKFLQDWKNRVHTIANTLTYNTGLN